MLEMCARCCRSISSWETYVKKACIPPKRGQIQTPLKKCAYFHVKTRVFPDITGMLWMQKTLLEASTMAYKRFQTCQGQYKHI